MTSSTNFAERYGPWAVVAGASVGIGAEFCRQIAAEGVNVVLVSRSVDKLETLAAELSATHGVETRVAGVDLAVPGAEAELFAATDGLEIGLFVYNAGADSLNTYFLDVRPRSGTGCCGATAPCRCWRHTTTARRWWRGSGAASCSSPRVRPGRAAVGSPPTAAPRPSTSCSREGLWAELRRDDVDVLSLVVGATDTPALRASLEKFGVTVEDLAKMAELADAGDVARDGLTHLGDGPTWQVGVPDGAGPSLLARVAAPSGRRAHHPGSRRALRRLKRRATATPLVSGELP